MASRSSDGALIAALLLAFLAMAISQSVPAPVKAPKANPPKGSTAPVAPAPKAAATAPTKAPAPTATNASAPPPLMATSPKGAPVPSAGPAPVSSPAMAPKPSTGLSNGTLDPSQVAALQALKVPVPSNPCAGSHSTMICDEGSPVRRLIFLQLQYCPVDALLSEEALKNLTGLQALSFFDCPMKPSASLPPDMANSLTSFSCVSSLGRTSGFEEMAGLSGVWLGKLHKVEDLTVMDVLVNASSLSVIVANMTRLRELKISNSSLKGELPKTWPAKNLTSIDLSLNAIQGPLPSLLGELEQLQSLELTGNNLTGHLPDSLGKLRSLQRLSLSSNALTGAIPGAAIENMTTLTYLDLSNNALNGSVPASITKLRDLRYLDLRNNKLRGILPFNSSFLSRLNSFKASGNPSLCYNSSIVTSTRLVVGVPACDDAGKPITSGGEGPALSPGEELAPTAEPDAQNSQSRRGKRHGPKTIVWAVATALGAIFLFIALIVVFSKWCRWKDA
ncbi:receptor-like protein 51 isoform X1 [Selaginella moellendorffii]|nr:receptor-like protein 51 isoform X1 [Selaginella moellendorffii]|eukprot:XP_002980652.2 receptor-like protein 51 isoform X1 [Selaginella moellendorffii]